MLELLSPELLFNKQKVFHLNVSVEKTLSEPAFRKIVVIYDQLAEVLTGPLKEMLDKLIQACQFKPEETVYLNVRFNPDLSLGNLQNEYQPATVLVFGDVDISRNLTKLKKNYPYELNGIKVLNAESLDTLLKNGEAKKVLWGVLKKMLGI